MDRFQIPVLQGKAYKELQSQLQKQTFSYRLTLTVISVLFPIIESYFVAIVSAPSPSAPKTLLIVFALVILIHVFLFGVTILAASPLPEFLVEFDDQYKKLEELQKKTDTEIENLSEQIEILNEQIQVGEWFRDTLRYALVASELSLLSVLDSSSREGIHKKDVLLRALKPWNDNRSEVFWFKYGSTLHNFVVYLMDKETNKLNIIVRLCDDRIVRADRSWSPGEGHVGRCFQEKRLILESDISDLSLASDEKVREEDQQYYKSFIAHPLRLNGTIVGVLVVTSNEEGQFLEDIHDVIMKVMVKVFEVALSIIGEEC